MISLLLKPVSGPESSLGSAESYLLWGLESVLKATSRTVGSLNPQAPYWKIQSVSTGSKLSALNTDFFFPGEYSLSNITAGFHSIHIVLDKSSRGHLKYTGGCG